jgi:tRNA-uridine 2-sulfurtransferase
MKALSIFSGGLDSILAVKLVMLSGVDVLPVNFTTPFFSPEKAIESAEKNNLPLKIVDITDRYFPMFKAPVYGFGGYMNPCIDCHALMLKIAGEMLEAENASFLVSGEVLGQRPMSQHKSALAAVEKTSTMKGLVLRPLSAKLLEKTIPEINGWVQDISLLRLSGRSRKPQIKLAKELGVKHYPTPGGGCLLTDPIFCKRFKDLKDNSPDLNRNEIEMLKVGRHFRINPDLKMVVGRDMKENERILEIAGENGYTINTVTVPGPVVYVSGKRTPETDSLAASMTASYSDAKMNEIELMITHNGKKEIIKSTGKNLEEFREYMIEGT